MSGTIDYKILRKHKLIYIHFTGFITISDVKREIENLSFNKDFSTTFNHISDLRDCQFDIEAKEVIEYINFMKFKLKIIDAYKEAIIVKRENEDVLSAIYSIELEKTLMKPEIFQTLEEAIEYTLDTASNFSYIFDEINKFRTGSDNQSA